MKHTVLLALIVCSSLTLFSGCAALLVGAAAGAGGVAYTQGELKNTESVALSTAHRAAERAVRDLKFAVLKSQLDGLSGVIEARTVSDQKITIKTKLVAAKTTEVRIRVGLLGDEAASRQILSRMQASY